ncbi:MAG: hypothetical protein VR65_28600 [Desulfobulbaceae bacterium BRH_c16a]|nr:MAG: hypothetical protein VR65_28600 [Desulfobulbaceae bacterium BRH_c16a]
MEQFHVIIFLSVIFLMVLAISIWKTVALKKENTMLSRQLTETSNSLEMTRKNITALREKQLKADEFQSSLTDAALSTRIQKSRATFQSGDRNRTTPEKYCYIHSLAKKGLSSDEIAAVLTISTHEARQLVTLAKIAQGN